MIIFMVFSYFVYCIFSSNNIPVLYNSTSLLTMTPIPTKKKVRFQEEEEESADDHDQQKQTEEDEMKFDEEDDDDNDEEEDVATEEEQAEAFGNEEEEQEEELDDEEDGSFIDEDDEEEMEDEEADEEDEEANYEEDIEDAKAVEARRKKLPKSAVDDRFFKLAEMEAFLESQDQAEMEQRQQQSGRNLGRYEMAQETEELIRGYEAENLQSRSWALQGEAVAEQRGKDELLEQFVDVDYRAAAPPTATEEKTAQLEALIRKRIKDKLFDDVVRKYRDNEAALVPVYRNQTDIEQSVRKSLADLYADKYADELNKQGEEGPGMSGVDNLQPKPAELDPKVAAIQKDMDELFLQLDALSHFQFRPKPIRDEVTIVNNMPSLCLEEVGPTATAEPTANLLAPEEVVRRVKAAPKAADERTETDRKRERRHKKKRQHVLASIGPIHGGGGGADADPNEMGPTGRKKFKRAAAGGGKKLDFAGGMQALVSQAAAAAQERPTTKKSLKRTKK